jgi:hypothetical protein
MTIRRRSSSVQRQPIAADHLENFMHPRSRRIWISKRIMVPA